MRILQLHSRYMSGDVSGENRSVEEEGSLLRQAGHDVVLVGSSMSSDDLISRVRLGLRATWGLQAARQVRQLLDESSFDVVHVHNLYPQLSPMVIRMAKRARVPVVMTLHNYRLGCLPALLFRQGSVCEVCVGKVPWRGVVHRCYRGSVAASGAMFSALTLHRSIGTFDGIDVFVAVSEFVRAKHIEMGIAPERIVVKPNFTWPAERRIGSGLYFLILSRLSPEKGVSRVVKAWQPSLGHLRVAGDGPERAEVERCERAGVEYLGPVDSRGALDLVREARAVIVPSQSYDAAPTVIAEAYAAGVPVIASRIGGIPERVVDGATGLLVPPEDTKGFLEGARRLLDNEASCEMGRGAHRFWREHFSPEANLRALMLVYEAMAPGEGDGTDPETPTGSAGG